MPPPRSLIHQNRLGQIGLNAIAKHVIFFLAFYHCRIAVAEYTIDGVPGMNIRLCFMKSPLLEANDSKDVDHHNMKTIQIDDNNHQVAIMV